MGSFLGKKTLNNIAWLINPINPINPIDLWGKSSTYKSIRPSIVSPTKTIDRDLVLEKNFKILLLCQRRKNTLIPRDIYDIIMLMLLRVNYINIEDVFIHASSMGRQKWIEQLILQGFNINIHNGKILNECIKNGDLEMVKFLMNKGIFIYFPGKYNAKDVYRPLYVALKNQNFDIIKHLILNYSYIDQIDMRTLIRWSIQNTIRYNGGIETLAYLYHKMTGTIIPEDLLRNNIFSSLIEHRFKRDN